MNSLNQIRKDIMCYRNLKIELGDRNDFKRFDIEMMRERKKSDTVFILGSGASLNDLTLSQWDEVFSSDTISFNFFLANNILCEKRLPTFHFMELPMKGRENQISLLAEILEYRKDLLEKAGTPFISRYRRFREVGLTLDFFPEQLRGNCYLVLSHLFHLSEEAQMKRLLWFLDLLWRCFEKVDWSPFIYHAGSISYTTMFAYLLGYKRIVLLGVDLNNPDYFWDKGEHRFYKDCRDIRSSVFRGYDKHVTASADVVGLWGQMPVNKFLACANDSVFRPNGISLMTGSEKSLLVNDLPIFRFGSL